MTRHQRAAGVLLHITSLPGPHGIGDFGPDAFHFIDWLKSAGQRIWQLLPLTPISAFRPRRWRGATGGVEKAEVFSRARPVA